MISIYDVLKASKGIDVDDTFAELWGRKLSNAYTIATYTGTLPATLQTVEGYLESYKIFGNTMQDGTPTPENPIEPSGCGERTVNLFNLNRLRSDTWTADTRYYMNGGIATSKTVNPAVVTISVNNDTLSVTTNGGNGAGFLVEVKPSTEYRLAFTKSESLDSSKTSCTYALVNTSETIGQLQAIYGDADGANFTTDSNTKYVYFVFRKASGTISYSNIMLSEGQTPLPYEPYGYKLPILSNSTVTDIYIGNAPLAKDEYVDSATGKIYRRTENLSPPEEEWADEWIWGDGTVHPSTEIKTSPFIDVSTCETCIMEVFSAETEWAAAGYREMAFYDENKQYLGWIGGGGRQTLTPRSTERLSEFPAGTVYVRISCSHGDQPFYPQLISGYTPVHQFYPYHVPTDPPAPFPQIPTVVPATVIDYNGEPKPDKVELTYRKPKGQ